MNLRWNRTNGAAMVKAVLVLVAAPLLMLALGAAERRWGPAVAGRLGAAPVSLALVVAGTGDAAIAAHAGAHVVAQVPFFLAFAFVAARRGAGLGVLAGAAAFALTSLPVPAIGPVVATAAAVPALLAATLWRGERPRATAKAAPSRATPAPPGTPTPAPPGPAPAAVPRPALAASPRPAAPTPRVHPAVSATAALAVVATSLTAARLAGPAVAGTVAAFPAVSAVFALVVARQSGPLAASSALLGAVEGLRGYLAFCTAAPHVGVAGGVAAAAVVHLAGRQKASSGDAL